ALILYGAFAHISSWVPDDAAWDRFLDHIENRWGTGGDGWALSMVNDKAFRDYGNRFERMGADPGSALALMKMNRQIDITAVLPRLHVPTLVVHRTDDSAVNISGGRQLAELIPGARLAEFSGVDHAPFIGENSEAMVEVIEEFLTGSKSAPDV